MTEPTYAEVWPKLDIEVIVRGAPEPMPELIRAMIGASVHLMQVAGWQVEIRQETEERPPPERGGP